MVVIEVPLGVGFETEQYRARLSKRPNIGATATRTNLIQPYGAKSGFQGITLAR